MNKYLLVMLLIANLGSQGVFAVSPDISEKRVGRTICQPTPAQVTEESRAEQVACGASHIVIRRTDHSVGWLGFYDAQESSQGEKNLNEQTDRLRILNSIGNVIQVASGDEHTLLLRSDRTVWAYGKGDKGQLGNGQNRHSLVPVRVSGITNALAIAAGGDSSLAIDGEGLVATWGNNEFGQLGDGTTDNRSTPVTISGLPPITAATMGKDHALAVSKKDGNVWIWGNNKDRQILDHSTAKITAPQKVPELSRVKAVAAGKAFSLALLNDNTVSAWGPSPESSPDGRDRGNPLVTSTPTQIPGLENVVQIAAGPSHALARLQNGTIRAWGLNDLGQLGDGTRNNQHSPVTVKGLEGITDIAAGAKHSCAVRNDHTVWSWGSQPTPAATHKNNSVDITSESSFPKSHSNRIKRNSEDPAQPPLVTFVSAPRSGSQLLAFTSNINSHGSLSFKQQVDSHPHSYHGGESECIKMSPPLAPSAQ